MYRSGPQPTRLAVASLSHAGSKRKGNLDGYLVTLAWNPVEVQSEIQVFDALGARLAQGPVARIPLPRRVPNGFHATYVSQQTLDRWK